MSPVLKWIYLPIFLLLRKTYLSRPLLTATQREHRGVGSAYESGNSASLDNILCLHDVNRFLSRDRVQLCTGEPSSPDSSLLETCLYYNSLQRRNLDHLKELFPLGIFHFSTCTPLLEPTTGTGCLGAVLSPMASTVAVFQRSHHWWLPTSKMFFDSVFLN